MGRRAVSESFLISSGGDCSAFVTGTIPLVAVSDMAALAASAVVVGEISILTRLGGGEIGGEAAESVVIVLPQRGEVETCSLSRTGSPARKASRR